jgi:predicted amidohydrolase YtcJ
VTSVKLFQDGIVENGTAALLEPYLDGRGRVTRDLGESRFAPAELRELCVALDREQFAVHAHAVGDRAVREVLDGLTASRTVNGPRSARHHIAHIQLIHPSDQPRFRALGVAAACQPFWAFEDEETRRVARPLLGPERVARMYPLGSLRRHGATLAFGSDWGVTTANPLLGIEVAVRRTDPWDPKGKPLGPASERLSPETALRAATRGSAHVLWTDDEAGTIELGRAADLVLLDRDPLTGKSAGRFSEARVLLTLVDGRPVWEDPALGA